MRGSISSPASRAAGTAAVAGQPRAAATTDGRRARRSPAGRNASPARYTVKATTGPRAATGSPFSLKPYDPSRPPRPSSGTASRRTSRRRAVRRRRPRRAGALIASAPCSGIWVDGGSTQALGTEPSGEAARGAAETVERDAGRRDVQTSRSGCRLRRAATARRNRRARSASPCPRSSRARRPSRGSAGHRPGRRFRRGGSRRRRCGRRRGRARRTRASSGSHDAEPTTLQPQPPRRVAEVPAIPTPYASRSESTKTRERPSAARAGRVPPPGRSRSAPAGRSSGSPTGSTCPARCGRRQGWARSGRRRR